jgi:hypothetical protein
MKKSKTMHLSKEIIESFDISYQNSFLINWKKEQHRKSLENRVYLLPEIIIQFTNYHENWTLHDLKTLHTEQLQDFQRIANEDQTFYYPKMMGNWTHCPTMSKWLRNKILNPGTFQFDLFSVETFNRENSWTEKKLNLLFYTEIKKFVFMHQREM